MTPEEAISLCRYVKACCPQQAIDEYTPLAWAEHLAGYPYSDAKDAAREITASQSFVTIAELLKVIRQHRDRRIREAGDLTPPPGPPGESDAEQQIRERAWLGEARRRIADGETVYVDYGELRERHLPDLRQILPTPNHEETTP